MEVHSDYVIRCMNMTIDLVDLVIVVNCMGEVRGADNI